MSVNQCCTYPKKSTLSTHPHNPFVKSMAPPALATATSANATSAHRANETSPQRSAFYRDQLTINVETGIVTNFFF